MVKPTRHLIAIMTLAVLVSIVATPAAPQAAVDRLAITQGAFVNLLRYGTIRDAEAAGFRGMAAPGQQPECVPEMGMHYATGGRVVDGKFFPNLPLLLFNKRGELIGFELESLVPQPTPPWEHLPTGHPGMEFEHWTLHVYIKNPATACSE